jgi:hypothetical protein
VSNDPEPRRPVVSWIVTLLLLAVMVLMSVNRALHEQQDLDHQVHDHPGTVVDPPR